MIGQEWVIIIRIHEFHLYMLDLLFTLIIADIIGNIIIIIMHFHPFSIDLNNHG